MTDSQTAAKVRAEALRLGFDEVGFTTLEPPPETDHLLEWIDRGYHGEMEYLARDPESRVDVLREHPWARTMICLLRSYPQLAAETTPLEGRISIYALGQDYHDSMGRDLKRLSSFLEEKFEARCRRAVDSSPILERPYARNAGLGWIGKNTLVLSRTRGSYFFLAELLTDLELGGDPVSATDHCGQCTQCLDRCPTQAFVAPYVLDARRCISYLTIEHRGVIPRDLRPLVGNWIFGCDVCQEVCPWNKWSQIPPPPAEFLPRRDLSAPRLADLMEIDAEEFRARFRKSPIWRAHRDGFVRNVAVALGNSRDPAAVAPLRGGLRDSSWLVRLHSAWGLGCLRAAHQGVSEILEQAQAGESHPQVREEIEWALCYAGPIPEE